MVEKEKEYYEMSSLPSNP